MKKSVQENGHFKNINNFEMIYQFMKKNPHLRPGKAGLSPEAMELMLENAREVNKKVNLIKSDYDRAIDERNILMGGLGRRVTRAFNSLIASDATEETIANARRHVYKIRGSRAGKKKDQPEATATGSDAPVAAPASKSVSQLSTDMVIDHLDKFLNVMEGEGSLQVNEPDLTKESLRKLHQDMIAVNTKVKEAKIAYQMACVERDEKLYSERTGMVAIARAAKAYVKSAFGARSPQSASISALKFKAVLKKGIRINSPVKGH